MQNSKQTVSLVKMALAVLLVSSALSYSSCKKSSGTAEVTPTPTPTTTTTEMKEEDVADAVSEAMVMDNSGMISQAEEVTYYAKSSALPCGGTKDTTVSGASATGAMITYSYNYLCKTTVTCTLGIPSKFVGTLSGKVNYSTARMTSDDSCTGSVTVTGLQPPAANYTVNLENVRKGSQTSKVREKKAFTSIVTVTGTSIIVNKTTMQISSGTASVVVTGNVTGGAPFTKSATLTFHGGKTATLTFSGGGSYPLSW